MMIKIKYGRPGTWYDDQEGEHFHVKDIKQDSPGSNPHIIVDVEGRLDNSKIKLAMIIGDDDIEYVGK